jgi:SAM-dependent methyltransferase
MANEYAAWSPKEYLAQYYATAGVAEDEKGILQFVLNFLLEKKRTFSEMLEVGCGPTIHHAVPFAPYVDRLYMADYLKSNLQEVEKWIHEETTAHDWTPYTSGMLAFEGNNSESAISERMKMIRSKITGLLPCNVLETQPLGQQKTFELVTSFYCLECVTHSKKEWEKAMSNVSSLVAPGGYIVLSALRKADKYMVCGKEFPATNIDENDLRTELIENWFRPETINISVCYCDEWTTEGFNSIIVCSAQKEGAQI